MKRQFLFAFFVPVFLLGACDLPTTPETPSTVRLMIHLWNYDLTAYEVFVNDTKHVTVPGRDPDTFFKSGYFTMNAKMNSTYQLEIKNAGYVYDAISFSVADDAVRIEPGGPYSSAAEYAISIDIKNGRLSL
jgi:hypothetical protein